MTPHDLPPDVRLWLPRPDAGSVRVSIRSPDTRRFVEIGRFDAEGQPRARVTLRPEELDRLAEVIGLCRRLLLGLPDARAEALQAQELVGLATRRRK